MSDRFETLGSEASEISVKISSCLDGFNLRKGCLPQILFGYLLTQYLYPNNDETRMGKEVTGY